MDIFTEKDLAYMNARSSVPADVKKQFDFFETGFDFVNLDRIATFNDGILKMDEEEINKYLHIYNCFSHQKKIVKFIPASGAASRMFKELFAFLDLADAELPDKINSFLQNLEKYPFFADLKQKYEQEGKSLVADLQSGKAKEIISCLLHENGLNYGNLPKALLKFHNYTDFARTAMEEHLVEAASYIPNAEGICYVHFTCSPNHKNLFKNKLEEVRNDYEARYHVKFAVDFSTQDSATDTLSATVENTPFRDENGNLFFRPAGHGALINNINAIDTDLLFIKNIDNIIPENKLADTILYKKVIGGYLLDLQKKLFEYQRRCASHILSQKELTEVIAFLNDELHIRFDTKEPSQSELFAQIHRPIRVCGMVKNEGAPGGGPFWVKNDKGFISCQIVESSQIDMNNPAQKAVFEKSTHFNPVDLVCGIKDFEGKTFDLKQFVDYRTGFISEKSYQGRTLKAMELPGLWNGSMADWITLFVDVPISTFNPAKTVFDLLNR